jgi:hypothetical protein
MGLSKTGYDGALVLRAVHKEDLFPRFETLCSNPASPGRRDIKSVLSCGDRIGNYSGHKLKCATVLLTTLLRLQPYSRVRRGVRLGKYSIRLRAVCVVSEAAQPSF